MTVRQMSRFYSGVYNLYKTTYSGGQITRQTASGTTKNISNNPLNTIDASYSAKNNFNANFSDAMTNLKNSAAEVKNLDFESADAAKTVENFLSDYNDAINFFNENSSLSTRVGNIARSFSDTKYFSRIYDSVGIVTNSDGTMKLDEEKFSAAIEKNPQKVSQTFKNLSSKADAHILTANLQKNLLFPTAQKMFGMNTGLYGKNNFFNSYLSAGSLFNIMF